MSADCLAITGGNALSGRVRISGAKNSALPLLFATILSQEPCVLRNVPDLEDIDVTLRLLAGIGAEYSFHNGVVRTNIPRITSCEASYGLAKAMRASFWVLGPLLARCGQAQVALPGGDAIGRRPVDLHLKGLAQLGADIRIEHGVVVANAPGGLRAGKVTLDFPSVGATHQILMAASLIPDETVIEGAAREPEIVELCHFLNKLGTQIEGAGSSRVRIVGRKQLAGATAEVLGDRIEAATYLSAAALTQGRICVEGISPQSMQSTLDVLEEAGCTLLREPSCITACSTQRLKAVSFQTEPFPGLATDVQPVLMAVMTTARGSADIKENIFEKRFGHIKEFRKFGAQIFVDAKTANVQGVANLTGAHVQGLDIRAAAGMVLMGLSARGTTTIEDPHHLERGYDSLIEKLQGLGADLALIPGSAYRELVVGC